MYTVHGCPADILIFRSPGYGPEQKYISFFISSNSQGLEKDYFLYKGVRRMIYKSYMSRRFKLPFCVNNRQRRHYRGPNISRSGKNMFFPSRSWRDLQQTQIAARDAPPCIARHPRSQRPGLQPGEVRVRRLRVGFPGSPHLHHWRRFPPGQRPGNLGNY